MRGADRRADLLVRGLSQRDRGYGVEGFTDGSPRRRSAHGTERVLIAYDRDEAGERGGGEAREAARSPPGSTCYRVQFPKGMDANEYALKVSAGGEGARAGAPLGGVAGQGRGTPTVMQLDRRRRRSSARAARMAAGRRRRHRRRDAAGARHDQRRPHRLAARAADGASDARACRAARAAIPSRPRSPVPAASPAGAPRCRARYATRR